MIESNLVLLGSFIIFPPPFSDVWSGVVLELSGKP